MSHRTLPLGRVVELNRATHQLERCAESELPRQKPAILPQRLCRGQSPHGCDCRHMGSLPHVAPLGIKYSISHKAETTVAVTVAAAHRVLLRVAGELVTHQLLRWAGVLSLASEADVVKTTLSFIAPEVRDMSAWPG